MNKLYCIWQTELLTPRSKPRYDGDTKPRKIREIFTCVNCGRSIGRYWIMEYVSEGRYLKAPHRICSASK